jgi:hypothetical protein
LGAASMEVMAQYFEIMPPRVRWLSEMNVPSDGSERVLDICKALNAKRYITGHGAKNYLDHEMFDAVDIRIEYMDYETKPFPQLHGAFTPYVTGLDLAANCGKAGREVIASGCVYWKDFI